MKTRILKLALGILCLLTLNVAYGQTALTKIYGTVLDEKGETAIGATVKVKGTKMGTITDFNGLFSLEATMGSVLQVSYMGYETQEVVVNTDSLTIVLVPQAKAISDLVVVGYGTVSKRDITTYSSMNNAPVASAAEAMQGSLSGVNVSATEASPDADVQIRVRGGSSITQSSEPLYIVDGFPVSSVADIEPSKIKSIDVMKDASATAIYGAQGANGVVVINTKSAKGKRVDCVQPKPMPRPARAIQTDEEYKSVVENLFKKVKDEPLSTFSLDVDAASYSNFRRMVNNGQMPIKDAVRVEEFLNYFSYNYPEPTNGHPVSINTETHTCPWAKDHLLVRVGIKAKDIQEDKLPASNFVFLIDVSGSMSDANKLPLVKSSLKMLTNKLRAKDRVAIVVYAGAAGVVLPSTSGADKQRIISSLDNLSAGGSTAGGEGIQLAYEIAQKNFVKGGNNRIILCTDGDFNVGVSSDQGLETLIEKKRESGVFLTVLGYGMGNYKDSKMQTLSQKGNGNNAYIDNIQEANKVLVNEFGATMFTVAKDVKLQVEFNPAQVKSYRLVGYETRMLNKEDFNDDRKDAGELGAGHTVTAFYEVVPNKSVSDRPLVDKLKYQPDAETDDDLEPVTSNVSNELLTVKLRYKPTNSDVSRKMEVPVMRPGKPVRTSVDYMFASSVVMFAQLIKDSEFRGNATYEKVLDLANASLGDDKQGYRREFVRLVEAVAQMNQ